MSKVEGIIEYAISVDCTPRDLKLASLALARKLRDEVHAESMKAILSQVAHEFDCFPDEIVLHGASRKQNVIDARHEAVRRMMAIEGCRPVHVTKFLRCSPMVVYRAMAGKPLKKYKRTKPIKASITYSDSKYQAMVQMALQKAKNAPLKVY